MPTCCSAGMIFCPCEPLLKNNGAVSLRAKCTKMLSLRTSDRCHWCGNPHPTQGIALRVPSAQTTLWVVSLCERQRGRIATPACALVRNDSFYLCNITLMRQPVPVYFLPGLLRHRYSSSFSFMLSGISRATGQRTALAIRSVNAIRKSMSSTICSPFITARVS